MDKLPLEVRGAKQYLGGYNYTKNSPKKLCELTVAGARDMASRQGWERSNGCPR